MALKLSLFALKVWPTLLSPLPSKTDLRQTFKTREEREVWDHLVEKPLSAFIEDHPSDDLLRGAVFTDAKISVLTHPDDPTLLQNRTFIYHTIGQGTGEWRVPVGGMGALMDALLQKVRSLGVDMRTAAEVTQVRHCKPGSTVVYHMDSREFAIGTRFVLFNIPVRIANRIMPGVWNDLKVAEGPVYKINMVWKRLPILKDARVGARDAFTGTMHLHEEYEAMKISYRNALHCVSGDVLSDEMYCHSLTDPSIFSAELQRDGYHTFTVFGLEVPYRWFVHENEKRKEEITQNYLRSVNTWIEGDDSDYLAVDGNSRLCIQAKSPLDLENALGLPEGNTFHGDLTFPFAEREDEAGTWCVETNFANVFLCGSSARRSGAVSGIPGHNAARKVLETNGSSAAGI